jgi:hypothetical protein
VTTRFQLALFSSALFAIPLGNAHAQSAERAPFNLIVISARSPGKR